MTRSSVFPTPGTYGPRARVRTRARGVAEDSAIWDPKSNRDSPAQGWIGRTTEWEGKPTVAVLTSALKNALMRRNEIILAAVLPAWKNQGDLVWRYLDSVICCRW